MNSLSKSSLFTDLSPESASQSKGGHWGQPCYYKASVTTVRVRYYPGGGSSTSSTVNLTNPEFDDGSIVNFTGGGSSINVTNPEFDDGSITNF